MTFAAETVEHLHLILNDRYRELVWVVAICTWLLATLIIFYRRP